MMPEERLIDCGDGVRLIRGRTMRTRDGTSLVSDHYLPPGEERAPTLLMRQPYGREIASTVVYAHPVWFARRGYNVVIQDVRGRGDSEGSFYPFRHEATDGYDAVQWVSTLPEANGKVGMYGFSYQGLTQLLAASEQPPALAAIAPAMTASDLYHGWFYKGGMFCLGGGIGWATQMLRGDAGRLADRAPRVELEKAWSRLSDSINSTPYSHQAHLTQADLPTYFADWVSHDTPGDYWAGQDISTRFDKINVPALHLAGWYDMFLQGSLDGYARLKTGAASTHARAHQYLLVGPWLHIPWSQQVGEIDFGPTANLATDEILVGWFHRWLKGDDSRFSSAPVQIFSMGDNAWKNLDAWPPNEKTVHWQSYFLHSDGKANSSRGDGTLTLEAPTDTESRDVLVVDPEVPVPAPGPGGAFGPYRQNRIAAGNNVLVYQSTVLATPLCICGRPRVQIWLASACDASDLVVKLTRIDRRGDAWFLCLGAARSQRLFEGRALIPDDPTLWEFELDATSWTFEAGERIGLEIAAHAFPLLDRSANVHTVPAAEAAPWNWKRNTQQIFHEPGKSSALILPLAV